MDRYTDENTIIMVCVPLHTMSIDRQYCARAVPVYVSCCNNANGYPFDHVHDLQIMMTMMRTSHWSKSGDDDDYDDDAYGPRCCPGSVSPAVDGVDITDFCSLPEDTQHLTQPIPVKMKTKMITQE
jgi:hypothetical protein